MARTVRDAKLETRSAQTALKPSGKPYWRAIEFDPIDSGHFALEDHCAEIGSLTRGFLARAMPARPKRMKQEIYPHANPGSLCGAANITEKQA